MKNKITPFLLLVFLIFFTSCITQKEIEYLQPNENLVIDQEGLVPYNIQEYRVTRNDIFALNIVTTPKGDAAQFYSSFNTSGGENTSGNSVNNRNSNFQNTLGSNTASNNTNNGSSNFYFNGIKVNSEGEIYVIGIGYIKAEGRTLKDIRDEIQNKVNENFLKDKTEVRLNLDGISYYLLGDVETIGITGAKRAYVQRLNITEAIAMNGGLNRTVDRKNIILERKYPEGIKRVRLDLTREDVMNSPYFWIQNGDMIYLRTRSKSLHGFGKDPVQTLTTGVSILTTALSIYLLITKL